MLKDSLELKQEPLFLMDGTAFIFRSFHAIRNMQRSDGFPTNALVGVTKVLLRILREEQPKYFLFVRDGHGPNFRHKIYPEYKANREATPEDLVKQIEPISKMLHALGIREEETHGFEADDCLASLAAHYAKDMPVIIISGDKDLKQCLGPQVFMWNLAAKEEKIITAEMFKAETGVEPQVWPDVQALIGDRVDNIPGVPGIGEVSALQIFRYCNSLEDLKEHLDRLPPKFQKKLSGSLNDMFLWRDLTRLACNYEPLLSLEEMEVQPLIALECQNLAKEFELVTLKREINYVLDRQKEKGEVSHPDLSTNDQPEQLSLLDLKEVKVEQAELLDAKTLNLGDFKALALMQNPKDVQQILLSFKSEDASINKIEYVFKGDLKEIVYLLKATPLIIVPDLKFLLKTNPSFYAIYEEIGSSKIFDLSLACYLLRPEESDFSWKHLEIYWAAKFQDGTKGPTHLALSLYEILVQRLEERELLKLYQDLELPLVKVLADMELLGLTIDKTAFKNFLQEVSDDLEAVTSQIYTLSGTKFNIRSAQQLGKVLYTVLKLKGAGKTKGGQASTSQQTLEKMANDHPVVEAILKFRKLEKIRSTYLEPLPKLADKNGRIHTTFNQKGTATGRLSSLDPNLQNIPVRGELGQRMRACFVAQVGYSLISSDYSQIELRVLAHMSQDEALIKAFKAGVDIHAHTAHLIFNLPLEEISSDQRRVAKTINFGLIYGMGAHKLAQDLKISLAEAKEFIDNYFASLSGLKVFYDQVVREAKAKGYVVTLGGRRRSLPDLLSANQHLSSQASRQAINTVIQGSA
ncbi:MAG: DNA polymerase I, partial [Desulfovibrionaceae bacterium]|nr:DNA polymerase I [Desulfovibrionaceae bacterium]